MSDDRIERALQLLVRPDAASPAFRDDLWVRLERELALAPAQAGAGRDRWAWTNRLRPLVAVAAAVVVVVAILALPSADDASVTTRPGVTTTTVDVTTTTAAPRPLDTVPGASVLVVPGGARTQGTPLVTTSTLPPNPATAGDRVAFIANGKTYVATIGSDAPPVSITPDGASDIWPDWSPDGVRIVVIRDNAVVTMADDGTDVRALTDPDAAIDSFPSWSPDGTTIAVQRARSDTTCVSAQCLADVYLVPVAGGAARRLTSGQYPSWSPDGRSIVFSDPPQGVCQTSYQFSCHGDLYVINVASGTRTALGAQGAFPHFSPDGTRIVYETGQGANGDVVVMDVDGTNARTLTALQSDEGQPYWTPDGRAIVYAATPGRSGGAASIYVMNADGTDVRYIADGSNPSVRHRT